MKRKVHISEIKKQSVAAGIGIGVVVAVIIGIVMTIALTSFVIKGSLKEEYVGHLIFATRVLSAMVGSLLASALVKEAYLRVIGFTVLGYLGVLLSAGIVAYDNAFKTFGTGVLSVIIGGVLACLIMLKPRRTGKHKLRIAR